MRFLSFSAFSIKFKSALAVLFISVFSNCTYIQIPFPNEIQGNRARKMIMDTIEITELLVYIQYPNLIRPESPYLSGIFDNMMFTQQELSGGIVPALIKINEKKMYKKDTVDACIELIPVYSFFYASQGISYPDILATISCNVEEASILQLGKFHLL